MTLAAIYQAHLQHLQRGTEAALAEHAFDALVLCSGTAAPRNRFDDQSWPLSPTPTFSHWCPLLEADAYVVVRPGKQPALVRTIVDDYWESQPPVESDHFWAGFEVIEVKPGHAGDVLPGGKVAAITRDPGTSPPGTVNPPALIAALDCVVSIDSVTSPPSSDWRSRPPRQRLRHMRRRTRDFGRGRIWGGGRFEVEPRCSAARRSNRRVSRASSR